MDWYAEDEKVDNLFLYYDCTSVRHRELFGVRSQNITSTTVARSRLGLQEGFWIFVWFCFGIWFGFFEVPC